MSKSRVKNSIANVSIGSILQIISMLATFGSRTVFIYLLGNDYLSVSGLFSNILTMLSFTELGIGNAIIYSLYKPLKKGDEKDISEYINFYGKAYRIIILVISILGLSFIPFLKYLIKDIVDIQENIIYIYILFLVNTIASYIFSHKKSLLIADEKNYVVIIIQQTLYIIQLIFQIIILFVTHNYMMFLIIQILFTMLTNILTTVYVNNRYRYISTFKKNELDKKRKMSLFDNIKSIFFYKLGAVILNGTDNIIISVTLKTTFIGLCSNYTLIINAINSVLMQAHNGLAASIANHNIEADSNRKEEIFNMLVLISYWVFGFCTICLAILLNPFIELWIGKQYMLSKTVVNSLVLAFYFTGINQIPSLYRTSMGIFKQAKYAPMLASIINIVLSILLAKVIGLAGIFIATSISKIVTFCIIDPLLVYKKGFNKKCDRYFLKFILFFLLLVLTYVVVECTINLIIYNGMVGVLLKIIVCVLEINCIFLVAFFRTSSFKLFLNKLKRK
ncbi:sugar translocase [Clostridium cadaveris]|uniref:lipopolysaccharide biosynthesis protein n=1 Tax=Clostridium cadaveris TaxID=1529 RepID=UPI001E553C7B|nr:sugar translocase [Clostridium cadaveris]UFH65472.1 sugar translocase [Clostridium cadaveris]